MILPPLRSHQPDGAPASSNSRKNDCRESDAEPLVHSLDDTRCISCKKSSASECPPDWCLYPLQRQRSSADFPTAFRQHSDDLVNGYVAWRSDPPGCRRRSRSRSSLMPPQRRLLQPLAPTTSIGIQPGCRFCRLPAGISRPRPCNQDCTTGLSECPTTASIFYINLADVQIHILEHAGPNGVESPERCEHRHTARCIVFISNASE